MTRAQIRETLKQIETASSAELLGRAASKQLTSKQRAFARKVAMGKTKAQAYREAYKADATPATLTAAPYRLAADARISAEIQALQQAELAASMQTPAQLRALVIQTLVQTAIDPDCKPAVRVQAAKVLGTVTEVAAFTTRTETRVTHSAEDAKAKVLEEIKALMLGTGDAVDVEAKSLLAELTEQGGEYAPAQVVDLYSGDTQPDAESAEKHGVLPHETPDIPHGVPEHD
jgi:predicted NAD-dependent protein-ADP-ribosyltransferase YbiA (DUF1768 family)